MATKTGTGVTKKALWGAAAFYMLIAFEIMYMAGPFAVYFYGVYNPILNFFGRIPVLSTLNTFFFPHAARETTSAFLAVHEIIGIVLAALGFGAFLFGACQIYYSKFARKGAVMGGIYNRIRHPQYISFAVCGFGLLLMWPRVINLFMYVTMLFVYYLLAKAEERECEEKFGQSYIDYKNRTNMFIPFNLPFKLPQLPRTRGKRTVILIGMYLCAMTSAFFLAKAMTSHFIDALYAFYTEDTAVISLAAITDEKMEEIVNIA
jgi:protein-S-isoprenylcysteine O-methyltransferase Ste14